MHIHPSESWEIQELDSEWAKRSAEWGDLRAAMDFVMAENHATKSSLHSSIWGVYLSASRAALEGAADLSRTLLIQLAVSLRAYDGGLTKAEVLECVTDAVEGDRNEWKLSEISNIGQLLVKGMNPLESDLKLKTTAILSAACFAVALAARGTL
jgi:hypothetical protein